MATGPFLIELRHVSKAFPGATAESALLILQDVCLGLPRGSSLAVVGPSGSGKSTLLNILGTLDRPSSGQVLLEGEELETLDDLRLARVRNRKIGFVFQAHYLLPQCSVLENVLIPTLAFKDGVSPVQAEARARRLLKRVGLEGRLRHRPGQLSGGERQRVAVVRALINEPQLLLADEPTGALDRSSAENLGRLLIELNQEEGVTLVVVTHAPELARLMQTVRELRDGALTDWKNPAPLPPPN